MMKFVFSSPSHMGKKYLYQRNITNYSRHKKQLFKYQVLNYFANILKKQKILQQFQISSQILENIPEVKRNNLKLIDILERYKHFSTLPKIQNEENDILMNDLEIKSNEIINFISHTDIFMLLNLISKIFPNKLIYMQFYQQSILRLQEAAQNNLLSNHEKVQLLYFISLKRKKGKECINFLKLNFPSLEELPLMEKCITAQALYKSASKLSKKDSKVLEKIIEEESEMLIENHFFLVSICKAIRITGPSNELSLKNLSNSILKSYQCLSFSTIVHVLCLYAEALIYDDDVIDKLIFYIIEIIENDSNKAVQIKLKDIDRFLWSISYLGVTLNLQHKQILKKYIKNRLEDYKLKDNLGILVNSILCLHMLQSWSLEIIYTCLRESIFHPVVLRNFHWKVKTRLKLLIDQLTLELKINVPEILQQDKPVSFNVNENVTEVAKVSTLLIKKNIVKNAIVECPIISIRIPGVTLTVGDNKYHIDVLDNSTCLKNSNIPHGLMKLKLRLLSQLNYKKILIDQNFLDKDISKIEERILKEIDNCNQKYL